MHEGGKKAIVVALLANSSIFIAKVVGFLITGAASMLAEAVHSLADTGNQALLLLGGRRAERAASAEHPFGYGAERYFWAFIVAMVIFLLGSLFALYEGVHKFLDPHPLEQPAVAIGILGVAILLECWSFKTAITEANRLRGDLGWSQFIKGTKEAELPVVLLEDLGALVGLAVALIAVVLSVVLNDPRWDAIGSIVIGLLLAAIAVVLAGEMKSLLIGEAASEQNISIIQEAIVDSPQVSGLIHMRTMHLGPGEILLAAKIEFRAGLSVEIVSDEINAAEGRIRGALNLKVVSYLEPDLFRRS